MRKTARPGRAPAPSECAQCGADIPPKARACPACGADERTGWREASIYDGIDLPDEAFDDDAAMADGEASTSSGSPGFGRKKSMPRGDGLAWHWWVAGVLLVIVLVASAFAIV